MISTWKSVYKAQQYLKRKNKKTESIRDIFRYIQETECTEKVTRIYEYLHRKAGWIR